MNGQIDCRDTTVFGSSAKKASKLDDVERVAGSDLGKGRGWREFGYLTIHTNFQHAVLAHFDFAGSCKKVENQEDNGQENDQHSENHTKNPKRLFAHNSSGVDELCMFLPGVLRPTRELYFECLT